MMPRFDLAAILRTLAPGEPADDGELLGRFVATQCESAFAELVRRHGRLVWTTCRHLTNSEADADDAFQATFVLLVRKANTIREPAKLSAWLHAAAGKICAKLRQAATRRTSRERTHAIGEADHGLPDSAWDRALAAVHEEASALPEPLRVAFVLCCLDGRSPGDAARQLGWKLGTLSGRLTRAKDAILARLAARGLTLGAIVGVSMIAPPATAISRTLTYARGGTIPAALHQLTHGVLDMSLSLKVKLLAATVLVACGLSTTIGVGSLATAQVPGSPAVAKPNPSHNDTTAELKKVLAVYEGAFLGLAVENRESNAATFSTAKYDFDLVECSPMGQTKFQEFLTDRETRGWDYHGTSPLMKNGKAETVWVFRRPTTVSSKSEHLQKNYEELKAHAEQKLLDHRMQEFKLVMAQAQGDAKATTTKIRLLERELGELKGFTPFYRDEIGCELNDFIRMLTPYFESNFPKDQWSIKMTDAGFELTGSKAVREFAVQFKAAIDALPKSKDGKLNDPTKRAEPPTAVKPIK